MTFRLFCILTIATTASSSNLFSQEKAPRPNLDAKQAAEQVTEASVAATVSFLASDELGGRGTGTEAFNIAAAYVASRLRAAGLQPGGDNETFYHETVRQQKRLPSSPFVTNEEGQLVETFGVLSATDSRFQFSGEVTRIDFSTDEPVSAISGAAVGSMETTAKGARAMTQLTRAVQRVEAAGAKVLLLETKADSEWSKLASQVSSKPFVDARSRINIPVVLVSAPQINGKVTLDIRATEVIEQPMRNVIGVLPGSDPVLANECIVFSAHLDHLGTMQHEDDNIYNGADDDASGVTAVLSLADAYSKIAEPKRTILFMTFWGEESGLLGSKEYVARPSWPLDRICANINIEMIGRPEAGARNKIWMTGWGESDLGEAMCNAVEPWGGVIFEHPKFSAMLYRASDNWSFAQAGVIAHSFSAGSLHSDYHKPDDEWERLEIPHMTRVIRNLFYGSLPIANGEVTPKKK